MGLGGSSVRAGEEDWGGRKRGVGGKGKEVEYERGGSEWDWEMWVEMV